MSAGAVLERAKKRAAPTYSSEHAAGLPRLSDTSAARAYGERAARLAGVGERAWEDVGPLLRSGWEGHHAEICPIGARHDWRLSWPAVQDGWIDAGGRTLAGTLAHQEAR